MATLARVANSTGGRLTERSNDPTLAAARAHRDLSCRYTLGFYDRDPQFDIPRQLAIEIKGRSRLAVRHAESYEFRSDDRKREASMRTAFVSPEMYATGSVRAHVFPLRPIDKKRWHGLLGVSFPYPPRLRDGSVDTRDFGGVMERMPKSPTGNPSVVHQFDRRVALSYPEGTNPSDLDRIRFFEHVELEPGVYRLRVVVSGDDPREPFTTLLDVEVPDLPRKGLELIGPILGKRAETDVVIEAGRLEAGEQAGKDDSRSRRRRRKKKSRRASNSPSNPELDRVAERDSFMPLIVSQLAERDDLIGMTQVCWIGDPDAAPVGGTIDRHLVGEDGAIVASVPPTALRLDEGAQVRCQTLADRIPASALPAGTYRFGAAVDADSRRDEGTTIFAVDPQPVRPAADDAPDSAPPDPSASGSQGQEPSR